MRNNMALGWFYSPSQIGRYILTRPTSLKPPRTQLRNPIAILRDLDSHQWQMFTVAFIGWTWDAFDFFTVALCVTEIAQDFGVANSDVTWGITITLMLRSVGALVFGALSDRFGRKWPFIFNLCLFIIFELASGFCHTLPQFLGVRALYGIAMGGLFGPAAATALEDLPYDARGLLSGLYQQGYAMGYLLASIFYRALVPTTSHGWRSIFWFGAAPPVFIIIYRWYLPETNHFQVIAAEREERHRLTELHGSRRNSATPLKAVGAKAWLHASWQDIKRNWVLFIYMVFLMTGFNSCSHGSQDLYPTFLKNQVGEDATNTTVISVVGQIGALIGGTFIGYISTFTGRRLIMLTCCVIGGSILPAYIIPRSMSLVASAFFLQFFVGGVWGPIPIHLSELAPPALRTTVVGLTYQLGNLASSASATIQGTIGERFPLPDRCVTDADTGVETCTERFNYGKVIAIFMGAVYAWMIVFLFIGPEMSEAERKEYAAMSDDLEGLRKSGRSLVDIGKERARRAWDAEHGGVGHDVDEMRGDDEKKNRGSSSDEDEEKVGPAQHIEGEGTTALKM